MKPPEVSALKSQRIHTEYCDALRQLAQKMRPHAVLRDAMEELMSIADSDVLPFSVAVFGRMKTGKSSLINAIIGKRLAITGVEEATATINRLRYADGDQLKTFTVHWKDAPPESFSVDALKKEWNGTTPEVMERVKRVSYLELYSNIPTLRDIHIIDTPGTGSTAKEHEDAAQQFIKGQQTDALVYVFPPVGRETDEENLAAFRKGCLPDSDPYNSIAVMHKWDDIYWDNGGDMDDIRHKAARLHAQMYDVVADVLPVSAPLALLAKTASAEFWVECLGVISAFGSEEELSRSLNRSEKWDHFCSRGADLRRRASREYDLPWTGFRVTLRHLYRRRPDSPEAAAGLILELSGISLFEKMIDERFFSRQAVIRQQQVRARARRVLRDLYLLIEEKQHEQEVNIGYLERLYNMVQTHGDLCRWVEKRLFCELTEFRELKASWNEIDSLVIDIREERDREKNAMEIERWLDSLPEHYFSDEHRQLLKNLLSTNSAEGMISYMPTLYSHIIALTQMPDAQIRQRASQLKEIITHILQNKS